MMEVHATMTALEARFEEELSSIPGWHSDLEKMEHAHGEQQPERTGRDETVEESMVLGV